MLVEEARKGGKKVAMNDEDNEIRLTDDEGSGAISNINLDHSNSTLKGSQEKFIGDVLPEGLIESLNGSKYYIPSK